MHEVDAGELGRSLQRYLGHDENRGHYARAAEPEPGDAGAYVRHIVDLRREELAGWRRTWWQRLPKEPASILDAGCGPGFVAAAMAHELPEARIVGVDVEPEAIAVAEILARDRPNLSFQTASLEELPPSLGSFDLVFCRTTLEHVFNPEVALHRMLDALAVGGSLFLETPNYLFPYEPHLQLWMVPKSPKWLLRAECRALGREADFVEHLQFCCDPRTLARWAREYRPVQITNLMSAKVLDVLEGRQDSSVPARRALMQRAAAVAKRVPWAVRGLAELPIWPSAQLLITRLR